jgi:molecular chaperone DnaK (HSP70)
MAEIVGLDFGTTNSLVSLVVGGRPLSLTDEAYGALPHPSVVWYHGTDIVVGRRAKAQLAEPTAGVAGDIVYSPKAYLGRGESLTVAGVSRHPSDVVAEIFRYLREDAVGRGHDFDRAVVTIPVTMDGRGRRELRDAALKAGVRVVQFVHEPLAALYAYLRDQESFGRALAQLHDKLVLVFDWGGGTLDLTLCRLSGTTLSQVANLGDRNIGGDRFDELLRNHVVKRHTETFGLTSLDVAPGADKTLIQRCEQTKMELSDKESSTVFVANYLRAEGPERTLEAQVTRGELESLTRSLVDEGIGTIRELLDRVGRPPEAIELCLATGGMLGMPRIRERLDEIFGIARIPRLEHRDRIISEGAAWIAHDRARLSLAKPLELLHADDSWVSVVPAHTTLPLESQAVRRDLGMYCVDPRDGYAKFYFARPEWPNRVQPSDPRLPYATLLVGVDSSAKPLLERLEVEVTIDHDLVAGISARSSLFDDLQEVEVHDLEFGLRVGADGDG